MKTTAIIVHKIVYKIVTTFSLVLSGYVKSYLHNIHLVGIIFYTIVLPLLCVCSSLKSVLTSLHGVSLISRSK